MATLQRVQHQQSRQLACSGMEGARKLEIAMREGSRPSNLGQSREGAGEREPAAGVVLGMQAWVLSL